MLLEPLHGDLLPRPIQPIEPEQLKRLRHRDQRFVERPIPHTLPVIPEPFGIAPCEWMEGIVFDSVDVPGVVDHDLDV